MDAIKWADGFDNYGTVANMLNGAWSSANNADVSVQIRPGGATGPSCLRLNQVSNCRRYLGGDFDRVVFGFRVRLAALPDNGDHTFALFSVLDAVGAALFTVTILPSGRIRLLPARNRALPIATSTRAMAGGTWNHIEVVFDNGTSNATILLNGREVINTAIVPGGKFSDVFFGIWDTGTTKVFVETFYDDMIASAGPTAALLGMCGVFYLRPIIDGIPQDWDYTSGTVGYALINEYTPDNDTNYIFAEGVDDVAAFGTEALPSNVTSVVAVIPIARVRKSDTGPCDVALGVRSDTDILEGDDFPLTTSYGYHWAVFETDPNTGDVWNPSALPDILVRRTL